MNNNSTELKSCPFCGRKVDMRTDKNATCGNGIVTINCDACDLSMQRGFILDAYVRKGSADSLSSVERQISLAWNKRSA